MRAGLSLEHNGAEPPDASARRDWLTGQFSAVDDLLSGRENLQLILDLYDLPRSDAQTRIADLRVGGRDNQLRRKGGPALG